MDTFLDDVVDGALHLAAAIYMEAELSKVEQRRRNDPDGDEHDVKQKARVRVHGDDAIRGNQLNVQQDYIRE